ncbi:MAG: alginate export family protein [Planctomycetota bacterium]
MHFALAETSPQTAAASLLAALSLVLVLPAQDPTAPEESVIEVRPESAFRLSQALQLPEWLRISGSARARYEGLEGQFRANPQLASSDHILALRQTLLFEVDVDAVTFALEGIDARQLADGSRSLLNVGSADAVDILQGYVEVGHDGPFDADSELKVGRRTVDFGGRRLVGRNRYRNTIQSFTGASYQSAFDDLSAEVFWYLPTLIRPSALGPLLDDDPELNDQDVDLQFYGSFVSADLDPRTSLEAYFYVVTDQREGRPERELYTPGVRALRRPESSSFDYEFEGNLQFGRSQATAGGPDLDHLAWFAHAELGYTFDAPLEPRVFVQLDGGSGDESANDGENNRFDPLFQVRADFGALGLFGPIARTNTLSSALKVQVHPAEAMSVLLGWRSVFLTEDDDFVAVGGVQDPSGSSGSEFGHKLELTARWQAIPDSLQLEFGVAHLFAGDVLRRAPNARAEDSTYVYFETLLSF